MSKVDLSTTIGNLKLGTCVYNASGCRCTTLDEIQTMFDSPFTALALSKSCTENTRSGNPKPRYYAQGSDITINSMGIPNLGITSYLDFALTNQSGKPFFLSLGGLSVDENVRMLQQIYKKDPAADYIHGLEINFSCPNIPGKPQLGYDMEGLENGLRRIFDIDESANPKREIGIKLPPYFDFSHYTQVVEVLEPFSNPNSGISFITCCNSIGNGLIIDSKYECPVIKPKGGFGGIGGNIMKPVGLANVRKFYELIGDKLDIVGCGGVSKGVDIFDYILCGASAVQVGSAYHEGGIQTFSYFTRQLDIWCQTKGYKQLSDFKGKLKTL
jgi:dihydroorotate dehydrogenase (fumarate)